MIAFIMSNNGYPWKRFPVIKAKTTERFCQRVIKPRWTDNQDDAIGSNMPNHWSNSIRNFTAIFNLRYLLLIKKMKNGNDENSDSNTSSERNLFQLYSLWFPLFCHIYLLLSTNSFQDVADHGSPQLPALL